MLTVTSCQKIGTIPDDSIYSKEELIKIFITETDEAIEAMNFDIDALMEEFFTPQEREKLLVQRIHNLISESAAQLLEELFNRYREEYNVSFLEGDFETKEEFAAEYLDKLINLFPNSFRLTCDWPAANCDAQTACENDPSGIDNITYVQSRCANEEIIAYGCTAQLAQPNDCDNSYFWESTLYQYNYPKRHRFFWHTRSTTYRAFMDDAVGGFRVPDTRQYSTFMGYLHEFSIAFTWLFTTCKHDAWIDITRFDAFDTRVNCVLDNPPSDREG